MAFGQPPPLVAQQNYDDPITDQTRWPAEVAAVDRYWASSN